MTIKILIDNSIDSLSEIMQGVAQFKELDWGGMSLSAPIVGLQRIPSRGNDAKWMQHQIECLPTVARLAREGTLVFHTYFELIFESWKRRNFPALPLGNLFDGIEIHHIDSAVERSRIFPSVNSQIFDKKEVIEFCKWLLCANIETLANDSIISAKFPTSELDNLRNAQRFREICKGLSDKQLPDALHLWTGEVNDLDFFLTTDRKFIRVMRNTKRIPLACQPISPEELLEELGITNLDPLPFEIDQFYTIWGTPH
jgi:hypothetical protein